jgi:hypothetical protein
MNKNRLILKILGLNDLFNYLMERILMKKYILSFFGVVQAIKLSSTRLQIMKSHVSDPEPNRNLFFF